MYRGECIVYHELITNGQLITNGHPTMGMGTLGTHAHMHATCMHAHMHECTKLAHHLLGLCHQVERDAYKTECDALKRKCEELRQDLEREKLHACKGPFGKGPMPDDVDDVGHEDKKAKSEHKQVNDVILIFEQHTITNLFAGQEEHHGNMLPQSPLNHHQNHRPRTLQRQCCCQTQS